MNYEKEEKFPMDQLPHHILINIFNFLKVENLKNVLLLNSFFYDIVVNSKLNEKFALKIVKVMADESKYEVDDICESLIASNRIFKDVKIFWRGYIITDSSRKIKIQGS